MVANNYVLYTCFYLPFKDLQEKSKIEELQKQWERDREASRERAKEFNKTNKPM
jgi:hypothetical protein